SDSHTLKVTHVDLRGPPPALRPATNGTGIRIERPLDLAGPRGEPPLLTPQTLTPNRPPNLAGCPPAHPGNPCARANPPSIISTRWFPRQPTTTSLCPRYARVSAGVVAECLSSSLCGWLHAYSQSLSQRLRSSSPG